MIPLVVLNAGDLMVAAFLALFQITGTSNGTAHPGVMYYHLRLQIDPHRQVLAGAVTALAVGDSASSIALDLSHLLTVDSGTVDGRPAEITRVGDRLQIPMSARRRTDAPTAVTIFYHGIPGRDFVFAGTDSAPTAASYGLPYSAREWWPCDDRLSPKADSVDIDITVPFGLIAASNGALRSVDRSTDGTVTYRWSVRYPIYPDVVSVAVARYSVLTSYYHFGPSDSLPLVFYVFPQDTAKARRDFSALPRILSSYTALFGPYPFEREKYGVAEFSIHSFREHQTIPSYGAAYLTGDHRNDWILAYDLAHQWFGNLVSVANWSDVWLNEGFATYASALWQGHDNGPAAYRAAMMHHLHADLRGSLIVPDSLDVDHTLTALTFGGAWVLHMLRHVMGDRAFFAAMRSYLRSRAYQNVGTADFERERETAYGATLKWFFDEWVLWEGLARYEMNWVTSSTDVRGAIVTLAQTQSDRTLFRMPLDLRVRTTTRDTTIVVWDSLPQQRFEATAAARVTTVALDPDQWILSDPTTP